MQPDEVLATRVGKPKPDDLLRPCGLLALLISLAGSPASADEPPQPKAQQATAINFLDVGKCYLIRFAPDANVFEITSRGVSRGYFKKPDGTKEPFGDPITLNVTRYIEVFRIIRLGGASWALLEFPSLPDDFPMWNLKHRALAMLADEKAVADLEETDEGRQLLAKLRELAHAEFKTSQSWVNLNYAIAIGDVPPESPQFRVASPPAQAAAVRDDE
jgi:hypothetical protein